MTTDLQPGDQIHVVDPHGVTAFGFNWPRGATIELDAERIASTFNRLGQSWLSDLSEAGQVERWGRIRLGLGAWPEGVDPLIPGSVEHSLARARARALAMGAAPRDRDEELRKVREQYGTEPTSSTIAGPTDPALALAAYEERQEAKRAAADAAAKSRRRVDLDTEQERDHMMDVARAASFGRGLERQEAQADADAIRERVSRG